MTPINDVPEGATAEQIVAHLATLDHATFGRTWVGLTIEQLALMSVRDAAILLAYVRDRYKAFDLRGRRVAIDQDVLRTMYLDQRMSCDAIAHKLGRSHGLVHRQLKALGIIRPMKDAMRVRTQKHFDRKRLRA